MSSKHYLIIYVQDCLFPSGFKKPTVEKQVSEPAGTPAERRNRFLQDVRCHACFPGSSGVFRVDLSCDTIF